MFECNNRWHRTPKWVKVICYSILGLAGTALIGLVIGFGLKLLWNWLMPDLFNLKEITYWQAIGIFILARFLFGTLGSNSHERSSRDRRYNKEKMDKKGNWSNWRYYDDWWDREGKKAFTDYVDKRVQEKETREDSEVDN